MAQKTILSLLALPTGPVRVFAPKDAAAVAAVGTLSAALTAIPAFTCALTSSPLLIGTLTVEPLFKVIAINVST